MYVNSPEIPEFPDFIGHTADILSTTKLVL